MPAPGEYCVFPFDPRDPIAIAEIQFRDSRDNDRARRADQPEPTRAAQSIIDWYEQNRDADLGQGCWAVGRLYDRTSHDCFLTARKRLENFCSTATSGNYLSVGDKRIPHVDLNSVAVPEIGPLAAYCSTLIPPNFDSFSLSFNVAVLDAHWGPEPHYVPERLQDGVMATNDFPALDSTPRVFGRHIDDGKPLWRQSLDIAARGGQVNSIDTPEEVKAFRRDVYEPAILESNVAYDSFPVRLKGVFLRAFSVSPGEDWQRDSLASLTNAARETRTLDQFVFEMIMDQMEIPDNTFIANLLHGVLASVNFDLLGNTTLEYYNARIRDRDFGARDQVDAHFVMATIENMRRAVKLLKDKATRACVHGWLAKLEKLNLDHFDWFDGKTYQRHNPLETPPPNVPAMAPGGCGAALGAKP